MDRAHDDMKRISEKLQQCLEVLKSEAVKVKQENQQLLLSMNRMIEQGVINKMNPITFSKNLDSRDIK